MERDVFVVRVRADEYLRRSVQVECFAGDDRGVVRAFLLAEVSVLSRFVRSTWMSFSNPATYQRSRVSPLAANRSRMPPALSSDTGQQCCGCATCSIASVFSEFNYITPVKRIWRQSERSVVGLNKRGACGSCPIPGDLDVRGYGRRTYSCGNSHHAWPMLKMCRGAATCLHDHNPSVTFWASPCF
jgi:hypothetical protein